MAATTTRAARTRPTRSRTRAPSTPAEAMADSPMSDEARARTAIRAAAIAAGALAEALDRWPEMHGETALLWRLADRLRRRAGDRSPTLRTCGATLRAAADLLDIVDYADWDPGQEELLADAATGRRLTLPEVYPGAFAPLD